MLGDKDVTRNHNHSWIVAIVWRDRLPIGNDFTEPSLLNLGAPRFWNQRSIDFFLAERDQRIRR
ncbi:hypothetical protein D3C72_2519200 [compost metagenome]